MLILYSSLLLLGHLYIISNCLYSVKPQIKDSTLIYFLFYYKEEILDRHVFRFHNLKYVCLVKCWVKSVSNSFFFLFFPSIAINIVLKTIDKRRTDISEYVLKVHLSVCFFVFSFIQNLVVRQKKIKSSNNFNYKFPFKTR